MFRHIHDLNDQACPAGEMLSALALPCFRIVLLPGKASLFPLLEYIFDENLAQL